MIVFGDELGTGKNQLVIEVLKHVKGLWFGV